MQILDEIHSPADIKALDYNNLKQLSSEIRKRIINRVAENGGHLASNLGVVELTIALHRVFDSPNDKLIWDVGHQSYTHKLLTGRGELFSSLRQYHGISGFTDRDESPHDAFSAGHGGTSISAALGMALARDLAKGNHHVVAIIGDGSITCGMAYEALNHAGHLGTKLIVVLNDNGMAISPTVGAIARHLNILRSNYRYGAAKAKTNRLISLLPLGKQINWVIHRLKEGIKSIIMPTMMWEQLGFTYLGPVNGHDIAQIENILFRAKRYTKPIVVHVLTKKGKGYSPAENNPVSFHGLESTSHAPKTAATYSDIFASSIDKLLRNNSRIVVISAAMVKGNGLSLLAEQFPERIYDTGISEQHAVTLAAGLATQGFIPILAIYSTFLQRGFDQILHDVCLQDLPVIFAIDRSGIVGTDGKTHQGIFDLSYLSLMPNMIVSSPKDENELQHLFFTATKVNHPMAIRYPKGQATGILLDPEFHKIPLGTWELISKGDDIAIIAIGSTVMPSIQAAEQLRTCGFDASVINARFVKPMDTNLLLDTVNRVRVIVTVEENVLSGGLGSSVIQLLQNHGISNVTVKQLGIPDEFVAHGEQTLLRSLYHLDAHGITNKCLELLTHIQPDRSAISRKGIIKQ